MLLKIMAQSLSSAVINNHINRQAAPSLVIKNSENIFVKIFL
jgi:hypothetical protein